MDNSIRDETWDRVFRLLRKGAIEIRMDDLGVPESQRYVARRTLGAMVRYGWLDETERGIYSPGILSERTFDNTVE